MDGIDIGVSNVPTNDDDVAETAYSAKASSKRWCVHNHRYNVVSSSTSSRLLYAGDNSCRPVDNSNGQPGRSGPYLNINTLEAVVASYCKYLYTSYQLMIH
nr:hypothetical protein [Tanacetum cinerariifolium]